MNFKVSVAIPSYNGAAYIARAVESILDQSRPPDQVMVVDDGSTDNSLSIIKHYPLQCIQHDQNMGLAAARNTAIQNAKGDILVFMDVDAVATPNLLEVLIAGYDSRNVAGVGGQGIEININTLADRWRRVHATQGHGNKAGDVKHLFGICMSYRVNILQEVGGFNPMFRTNAEDVDIGLRLTNKGLRLKYLPNAMVYHQRSDDESSLMRTVVAWRVAGYEAKKINDDQPWTMYVGAARRLLTDPIYDLIIEKDIEMARLSWKLGWAKLRGLQLASNRK